MTESMTAKDNRALKTPSKPEYACLFCMTGREESVAQNLLRDGQVTRATTARMVKRKTNQGQTRRVEEIMLPGYVFVEAPGDMTALPLRRGDGVIKVLYSMERDWKLCGTDKSFAQWLFAQNGLLGFSKACQEDDRIKIISGPLKDLEGAIIKVDKRNTSGLVAVQAGGREFRVWLGFDIVEKALSNSKGYCESYCESYCET